MKQIRIIHTALIRTLLCGSVTISFFTQADTSSIERIANKYNLSGQTCKPLINPSENKTLLNEQFACFITQKMPLLHIAGLSLDGLKKQLNQELRSIIDTTPPQIVFTTYSATQDTWTNHLIFYTEQIDEAKKNGALLALYLLNISVAESTILDKAITPKSLSLETGSNLAESIKRKIDTELLTKYNSIVSHLPTVNEYLVGTLLGISDADLTFQYQRHYFLSIDNPLNIERPSNTAGDLHQGIWYAPLNLWPKETQVAFKKYIGSSDLWNINFHTEKAAAQTWLDKYKNYSYSQLRAGIDLMSAYTAWQQLPQEYEKKPHIRKILDQAIKLQKLVGKMNNISNEDFSIQPKKYAKKTFKQPVERVPHKKRILETQDPDFEEYEGE